MCFALRHADNVLANSDFTRDTLVSLIGVQPGAIVMTYPDRGRGALSAGVALRRPASPASDSTPEQRLILSVGRLQRRKGFDQVVRALPGLLRAGSRRALRHRRHR